MIVKACDIPDGGWFKKEKGTYVYLRISESSAQWAAFNTNYIWGVCFNGNITKVLKHNTVCQANYQDYLNNISESDRWENKMGCQNRSNYGSTQQKLKEHLSLASSLALGWPKWKQDLLCSVIKGIEGRWWVLWKTKATVVVNNEYNRCGKRSCKNIY